MAKRKPTRRQKQMMMERKLKPEDWLIRKAPAGELHLEHKHVPSTRRVLKVEAMA